MTEREPVLRVRQLSVTFGEGTGGAAQAGGLDDVCLELERGRVLALVGPCGSGKTLTALSILRLLPQHARVLSGQVLFNGRDLLPLAHSEMARVRGRGIAMVFQEPATALSPVHTIGRQLSMALAATGQVERRLFGSARRQVRARACELLGRVELPEPERLLSALPHQLSAGMRRRVLIALALAGDPELLIADEPTAGLDATVQAQILDLLARLTAERNMGLLFITHDLRAVAELASELAVMYAGQVVEAAPVPSWFEGPQHPYARLLLNEARRLDAPACAGAPRLQRPEPAPSTGCRFAPLCPQRSAAPEHFPRCTLAVPALEPPGARHSSRCHYPRLGADLAHD